MADIAVFFDPAETIDFIANPGDTVWWINKNNSSFTVQIQTPADVGHNDGDSVDAQSTSSISDVSLAASVLAASRRFDDSSARKQHGKYHQSPPPGGTAGTVIVVGPSM